ncbi:hypothetical protein AVEN_7969-1 [Araneus ventricosus]|uniref:Chitin-binding type-2 domain-containing protein n=1 Tax=Araneus ventricosus TaxID=182803 RepID=A0A4Y2X2V2_ARAVE|nr:hypothetical protein AVEN_7969-1 [Araneus ventricosus]
MWRFVEDHLYELPRLATVTAMRARFTAGIGRHMLQMICNELHDLDHVTKGEQSEHLRCLNPELELPFELLGDDTKLPDPKYSVDPTGKDPLCEEATGQVAHPKNSSLFYRCENGVKYLKSCSHPLIYNALDQVCDWPHNVQDKSIEEIPETQGTADEITESGSALSAYKKSVDARNSDGMSCLLVPGVTCPCACRVTTYDDCDSFYHCRGDGEACKRRCPEGLHFNRKTMVCDLPRNVECRGNANL